MIKNKLKPLTAQDRADIKSLTKLLTSNAGREAVQAHLSKLSDRIRPAKVVFRKDNTLDVRYLTEELRPAAREATLTAIKKKVPTANKRLVTSIGKQLARLDTKTLQQIKNLLKP